MILESEENDPKSHLSEQKGYSKVRVLIVDDHQMMRSGLRKLINGQEDLEVVAEASDGTEVMDTVKSSRPDVIIMDVDMPKKNGIEATLEVHSIYPKLPVIGLSLHDNKEVANAMMNAGARAYISKTEAFDTLCNTIRQII